MPSIYQTKDPGFILEQVTMRESSREDKLRLKSNQSQSWSRYRVRGSVDGQMQG